MYLLPIANNTNSVEYVNRILQFCQLEIEIDCDNIFEGSIYFMKMIKPLQKTVKYKKFEYFNHQITNSNRIIVEIMNT